MLLRKYFLKNCKTPQSKAKARVAPQLTTNKITATEHLKGTRAKRLCSGRLKMQKAHRCAKGGQIVV